MSNLSYPTTEVKSNKSIRYYFLSKGKTDIIKAIEHTFVTSYYGWKIYNLGFGDYDLKNDSIDDLSNTNNDDAYQVLNTVLNTIPKFFDQINDGLILVEGSDSNPEFVERCKSTCIRSCSEPEICKNQHKRIRVYRNYVEKNFATLKSDYTFYGGMKDDNDQTVIEDYVAGKKYDSVLVFKNIK